MAGGRKSTLPQYVSQKANGVYYYRRGVPETLRDRLGVREYKKSLGSDHGKMLKAYAQYHTAIEKILSAKPKRVTNLQAKILSVLEGAGFPPEALPELRGGITSENEAYFLALDAAVEEMDADEAIPLEAIQEVLKGKLVVTLEAALDLFLDARVKGDSPPAQRRRLAFARHRARLIAACGSANVVRHPVSRFGRQNARRAQEHFAGEMSASSVNRAFNDIRAAVNYSIREFELNIANPFNGLSLQLAGSRSQDRLPFTEEDMDALAPLMETEDDLGLIWCTLRDTGARSNEVAGIEWGDVYLERKALWIGTNDSRRLKTGDSERLVPIPDALAARYEALKGNKSGPVFPQYVGGRKSDNCSAALMKRIRKITDDKRKVAYSLRHRMKDRLRNTNCPEMIQREIMGHANASIADSYGSGTALDMLRERLEKVW